VRPAFSFCFFLCAVRYQHTVFIIGINDVKSFGKVRFFHIPGNSADDCFTGSAFSFQITVNAGVDISREACGPDVGSPIGI
jgi:hypothetical protein